MSKLIERLIQTSKTMPQPLGFGRVSSAMPKPTLLLIAEFTKVDRLADYADGADAGLLLVSSIDSGAKVIQEACRAASGIPWGGWLRDGSKGKISEVGKAGGDFVVFPVGTGLAMSLEDSDVGKVLEVETGLSEGRLMTINELPVNAVLVTGKPERDYLSWDDLMEFQRAAALVTKPLLVAVPSNLIAAELKALWEVGVDGIVVSGQSAGKTQELRQLIDTVELPSPRKRAKGGALVPRVTAGGEEEEEEEEEE